MSAPAIKPRWRKVLADLWGNKARTLLVVASIAVGVLAIGVIAGAYVVLVEDLDASYASTNPAHISLLTTPFEQDVVDAVRGMDGVSDAEGRREFALRVQTDSGTWDSLVLAAIPDMGRMDIHRLAPQEGQPLPGDRQVVLERKTLAHLDLAVGEEVTIELPDGTLRRMPVVGSVLDQNNIYALIQGEWRGYVTYDSLTWLHQPNSLDRLYVTAERDSDEQSAIDDVAAAVVDRLEKSGHRVLQTSIRYSDRHPLAAIIQALVFILIIIGVLIVFLSGSLISNTMSALLTQHIRQIGVMKLVGARRPQVIAMYAVLVSSFGLIALLLAVPLGSWGAHLLGQFVADIVNFVPRPFRVVPQVIALQVFVALLVPPVTGLLPVLKGSRTSVRQAISSTGLGDSSDGRGWIDRQFTRLRGLSRPILLSLRNTFRRKGRLALTLFTLTLGGAVFIAVFSTQATLNSTIEQTTRYFGADINLELSRPYRAEKVIETLLRIDGVQAAEAWMVSGGDVAPGGDGQPVPIAILAPPVDSPLIEPTLLAGRWLRPGDQAAITVNEAIWDELPSISVGDTLQIDLQGQQEAWTIVGIFRYTGVDDLVAYAPYDYVATITGRARHASTYRITTVGHRTEDQQRAAEAIAARLSSAGFGLSSVQAGSTLKESVGDLLGILTRILLVMALMTALVGSIGLTGTMSMNVMERTREIGVLRAIGAHDGVVFRLVIMEGTIIGVLSFVLGAILSFPISVLLSNVVSKTVFGTPAALTFSAVGFLLWLAAVLALSFLASVLPARSATRLTIREVLAYE